MNEAIIPIVESYLEGQRLKKDIEDQAYLDQLLAVDVPQERVNLVLDSMEEARVEDMFLHLELKRAKRTALLGYTLTTVAVVVTLLSVLGVFMKGESWFIFYGAIGAGILAIVKGRSAEASSRHQMKMRHYTWKKFD